MALTHADKQDIQEMHDVTIKHIREILTLTTENIKMDLIEIKAQTTKTNGRVTALERELPHSAQSCPNKTIIDQLRDAAVEKKGESKWKDRFKTVLTVVISCIVTAIAIFEFILKYNPE